MSYKQLTVNKTDFESFNIHFLSMCISKNILKRLTSLVEIIKEKNPMYEVPTILRTPLSLIPYDLAVQRFIEVLQKSPDPNMANPSEIDTSTPLRTSAIYPKLLASQETHTILLGPGIFDEGDGPFSPQKVEISRLVADNSSITILENNPNIIEACKNTFEDNGIFSTFFSFFANNRLLPDYPYEEIQSALLMPTKKNINVQYIKMDLKTAPPSTILPADYIIATYVFPYVFSSIKNDFIKEFPLAVYSQIQVSNLTVRMSSLIFNFLHLLKPQGKMYIDGYSISMCLNPLSRGKNNLNLVNGFKTIIEAHFSQPWNVIELPNPYAAMGNNSSKSFPDIFFLECYHIKSGPGKGCCTSIYEISSVAH